MVMIPEALTEHVSEFTLPTGARIRLMADREAGQGGWVVDLDGMSFLYRDGSRGPLPRHRAFSELGFPGGEDDLRGEEDWRAVEQRTDELKDAMLMELADAWELARAYGAANRHAREGETATLRRDEQPVLVLDPGTTHDRGHYVQVRYRDGREGAVRLLSLRLDD